MNAQQTTAYRNPTAVADGVLPENFFRSARVGRHGYRVGLSLNK